MGDFEYKGIAAPALRGGLFKYKPISRGRSVIDILLAPSGEEAAEFSMAEGALSGVRRECPSSCTSLLTVGPATKPLHVHAYFIQLLPQSAQHPKGKAPRSPLGAGASEIALDRASG